MSLRAYGHSPRPPQPPAPRQSLLGRPVDWIAGVDQFRGRVCAPVLPCLGQLLGELPSHASVVPQLAEHLLALDSFPARRWLELCEHHDVTDSDPPCRDEQRAWYDTLRNLVPSIRGLQPTVRRYARDYVWCSLDPDNRTDGECFSDLIHARVSRFRRTTVRIGSWAERPESTLRVAMIFPEVDQRASNGVPPSCPGTQQPDEPTAKSLGIIFETPETGLTSPAAQPLPGLVDPLTISWFPSEAFQQLVS